ncbi:hypothetical protein K435DRAFT_809147 [Dendrothele bispora CBS 962.96]|uniref:DUF4219 domain-containing protein n=1 Tax=Dendrothele bispora (strain CBS 962.96) TaxID=1314807 RepID=A0A4S8KZ57_DENBC|nr:hypothetical protein K435DRAFT_809147 [Dendrothele bispora CBS 962.96]
MSQHYGVVVLDRNSFANFENLNANNWTLWSNHMKNYLRIQNCWFAIEKAKSEYADHEDKLKDWEEANQKAIGIIGMKIPTNLSHLQKDTAKDFWETLQSQYGKVGTAALVTKLLDLFYLFSVPYSFTKLVKAQPML